MVVWLLLSVPCVCLRFVIVVFPGRSHLLFLKTYLNTKFGVLVRFECIFLLVFKEV